MAGLIAGLPEFRTVGRILMAVVLVGATLSFLARERRGATVSGVMWGLSWRQRRRLSRQARSGELIVDPQEAERVRSFIQAVLQRARMTTWQDRLYGWVLFPLWLLFLAYGGAVRLSYGDWTGPMIGFAGILSFVGAWIWSRWAMRLMRETERVNGWTAETDHADRASP